jgi:hypothetical protein
MQPRRTSSDFAECASKQAETAQFRLEKDKMLWRVEDMKNKEREYIVISIVPKN